MQLVLYFFAFQVYWTETLSNSSKCNFITSKIILLSEITLQEYTMWVVQKGLMPYSPKQRVRMREVSK